MPTTTRKANVKATSLSKKSAKTSARKPGTDRRGRKAEYSEPAPQTFITPDDIDVNSYREARKKKYTQADMGVAIILAISLTVNAVLLVSWLYWR
jgi:cobalamin biosynthesis Mg chelatase CobN